MTKLMVLLLLVAPLSAQEGKVRNVRDVSATEALERLMKIEPKFYRDDRGVHFGLLASQIDSVDKALIEKGQIKGEPLQALMIRMIQEQQKFIGELVIKNNQQAELLYQLVIKNNENTKYMEAMINLTGLLDSEIKTLKKEK